MKLMLLIFLTTICTCSIGQTFKNDWKDFSVDNWTVLLSLDRTKSFGNKDNLGNVQFINSAYDINVTYYVFHKRDIDSAYIEAIENWYLMQSECLPSGMFSSFEKGDFYYQTDICNTCGELIYTFNNTKQEAPERMTCDNLVNELSQYLTQD